MQEVLPQGGGGKQPRKLILNPQSERRRNPPRHVLIEDITAHFTTLSPSYPGRGAWSPLLPSPVALSPLLMPGNFYMVTSATLSIPRIPGLVECHTL